MSQETIFLIFLLLFAFLYRLWFAGLAYPDAIFDEDRYVTFANQLLDRKLVTDCCDKPMGYPFFIASILAVSGRQNLDAVRLAQIFIEIGSIFLIYQLSIKQFGKSSGYVSSILYAVNPFTASYVGLLLPEVLTIFILLLLTAIVMNRKFSFSVFLWFIFGILITLLILIRKQFITVAMPLFLYVLVIRLKNLLNTLKFLIICIISIFLVSAYSLYANYSEFQKLTIFPPYLFSGYIYLLNYSVQPYPELLLQGQQYEPIYFELGQAWHSAPLTEKESVNRKYKALFRNALKTNFNKIIRNYSANIFMIWDRDHLFYYFDVWYPHDSRWIRILNWLYIGFALVGSLIVAVRTFPSLLKNYLFIFSMIQLAAITFLFTLYSNEPRHSLEAWGVITIWAGRGIVYFKEALLKYKG